MLLYFRFLYIQARVQGGARGLCYMFRGKGPVPPPLEIEKQKKVIKGNFNYAISPIFCYFFSRKYHFLCYFLSCPPPLEKVKHKKNCFSDFRPPPSFTISWTRHCILYINSFFVM